LAIKISQIYFHPSQLGGLDKAFIPYDNCKSEHSDLREFFIFQKEYLAGHTRGEDHVGYISWKFGEKTKITGQRFIEFCEQNPGYDIYLINPFPMEIYIGNIWRNGESFHEGITELTQHVLDKLGYDIKLTELATNLKTLSFCNYWVANEKFWNAYMDFCLPVYDYLLNRLEEPYRSRLNSVADRARKASYFSFIFERLLTTFLQSRPHIKYLNYSYSKEELLRLLQPHEAALVDRIQVIEKEFPHNSEAITKDQTLLAALHYYSYYIAFKNPDSLKAVFYALAQAAWHSLPFRSKIQQNSLIRLLHEKATTRLLSSRFISNE
jgi:hypothetical protein